MSDKLYKVGFVAFLVFSFMLFAGSELSDDEYTKITGRVIHDSSVDENDFDNQILIDKSDLKECCSFIDDDGQERTCFAVNRFSCDYCMSVC